MIREGHIHLDTTQEFNWPKRVRCNECGRFLARGLMNQVDHFWLHHVHKVEYTPLTEIQFLRAMEEINK